MSTSPFSRVVVVASTGSTNEDLRHALAGPGASQWPHLSVLRARTQLRGRGRVGRAWETPASGALTASLVLRPLVPAPALPWLPLLVGLAVADALAPALEGTGWRARTKWPNDVVLVPGPGAGEVGEVPGWGRSRKVAGVLTELVPALGQAPLDQAPARREEAVAAVVGVGLNTRQEASALPVPWATSLALAGARAPQGEGGDPEEAWLEAVGHALVTRLGAWEAAGGRVEGPLREDLVAACSTLGQDVEVALPGGGSLRGRAVDLAPGLVLRGPQGEVEATAGDVLTTRRAGGVGTEEAGEGAPPRCGTTL